MIVHLLDTNLLIALAWPQHVHHAPAHAWFGGVGREAWATCPLTQLAFLRISSNPKIIPSAASPTEALAMLRSIVALPGHEFWPDEISPITAATFSSLSLVGHRQITDAYLLALAQNRSEKLATFDRGIAELIRAPEERARYLTVLEEE